MQSATVDLADRSKDWAGLKLAVSKLAVNRGGRRVVDSLSFDLKSGNGLELVGPNGSGKTTLIRAIAGLIQSVSGNVALADTALRDDPEPPLLREAVHYVGHTDALKPALSAFENLHFWQRYLDGALRHGSADETVMFALDTMRLGALSDVPAGYLSAGQKRRLGLARLLVADRPLWLLDEPSVSLDVASVAELAALADAHVARGGLLIAATHVPLGMSLSARLDLGIHASPSGTRSHPSVDEAFA